MTEYSALLWFLLSLSIFISELFYPFLKKQFCAFAVSAAFSVFASLFLPFFSVCILFAALSVFMCFLLNKVGKKTGFYGFEKAIVVSVCGEKEYKILYNGKVFDAKSDILYPYKTGDLVKIVSRTGERFEFSSF